MSLRSVSSILGFRAVTARCVDCAQTLPVRNEGTAAEKCEECEAQEQFQCSRFDFKHGDAETVDEESCSDAWYEELMQDHDTSQVMDVEHFEGLPLDEVFDIMLAMYDPLFPWTPAEEMCKKAIYPREVTMATPKARQKVRIVDISDENDVKLVHPPH